MPPPLLSLRDATVQIGGQTPFAGLSLAIAKGDRICRFSFGVQPIATTMRLQIGLALTSARLNGLR